MTEQLLIAAIADIEVPRIPIEKLEDNAASLAYIIEHKQFNADVAKAATNKLAEILLYIDNIGKARIAKEEAAKQARLDKANRYKQLQDVLNAKKEPKVTPNENPVLFYDLVTHLTGQPPRPGTLVRSLGVDWMMNDEGTWEAMNEPKRQTGSKKKPLTPRK